MYLIKWEGKIFELVFGECSRILCSDNKKREDEIKLWRKANDGMFLVQKLRKPEKEQFTIIGIQVAGNVFIYLIIKILKYYYNNKLYYFIGSKIQLNALMTDKLDIN